MATTPVKSQPLHNFPFSFLKWGTTTHGGAVDHGRLPDSDADPDPLRPARVGSRSARVHRFSSSSRKVNQHRQEIQIEVVGETAFSKHQRHGLGGSLSSKVPKKVAVVEEEDKGAERVADAEEEEEAAHRPWNLRPRRSEAAVAVVLALEKQGENSAAAPKSMRLRASAENGVGGERKGKRKFWIALSKEEIEEDIFVMTGSRPARRPRKRPKNVQKQLDSVFPGLWLVGSTADAFRVADAPVKR